jgi:hypothetical protein
LRPGDLVVLKGSGFGAGTDIDFVGLAKSLQPR